MNHHQADDTQVDASLKGMLLPAQPQGKAAVGAGGMASAAGAGASRSRSNGAGGGAPPPPPPGPPPPPLSVAAMAPAAKLIKVGHASQQDGSASDSMASSTASQG